MHTTTQKKRPQTHLQSPPGWPAREGCQGGDAGAHTHTRAISGRRGSRDLRDETKNGAQRQQRSRVARRGCTSLNAGHAERLAHTRGPGARLTLAQKKKPAKKAAWTSAKDLSDALHVGDATAAMLPATTAARDGPSGPCAHQRREKKEALRVLNAAMHPRTLAHYHVERSSSCKMAKVALFHYRARCVAWPPTPDA